MEQIVKAKVSRRSFAAMLGAVPFVGNHLAQQTNAGMGSTLGYAGPTTNAYQLGGVDKSPSVQMERWQAARMLMSDKELSEAFREFAFRRNRQVSQIDPDINVYRSFSPMAKITFQRQRNVAREIEQETTDPVNDGLRRFGDKLQKLMWGR